MTLKSNIFLIFLCGLLALGSSRPSLDNGKSIAIDEATDDTFKEEFARTFEEEEAKAFEVARSNNNENESEWSMRQAQGISEAEEEPKKWRNRGKKTKKILDSLAKWYLRVFTNPPQIE